MEISRFKDYSDKIIETCGRAILGKEAEIRLVLICFVCSGHVLLEDVPGTGKTMLLRAFSGAIGGDFSRIQFTPDLLPSDLTGINFYNQKSGEFEFRPGPLFANIVLADEINRATPRTQSSMLEAMEEKQITIDNGTYPLPPPFMVMATQNPIESYGTFPLPEAQIDRFFMRLSLGYMEREQEKTVIQRKSTLDLVQMIQPVVTREETQYIMDNVSSVRVSEDVIDYIMDIVEKTRSENAFVTGVSTRGAICLYKAAQALAAFSGRDYVIPEDVVEVASPVLAHRIAAGAKSSNREGQEYLKKLIAGVKVPLEDI